MPAGGSESLLLVDDEPAVRSIARKTLEEWGYLVQEAATAEDALALCQEKGTRFDLLVTDVVLPGMSGRELSDQVKEICPRARSLFVSGYTDEVAVRHGLVSGEHPYLQKPFTPTALALKVRQILDEDQSESLRISLGAKPRANHSRIPASG